MNLQEVERALREFTDWFEERYPTGQNTSLPGARLYGIYIHAMTALAAAPSGPGLEAQLAQVERAWSRDRESLEAALYRLREAQEVIEELRRHGCDWIVERFTIRLQEAERALREAIRRTRERYMAHTPERYPNTALEGLTVLEAEAIAAALAAAAASGPDEGICVNCNQVARYHDANGLCGLDPGPPHDDRRPLGGAAWDREPPQS